MSSNDIYAILIELCPNVNRNIHYLNRYVDFISACLKSNKKLSDDVYTEKHHICPKSMWPQFSNFNHNPWNCSVLTPRQHFLAHWMLARAFGGGMWHAFSMMVHHSSNEYVHVTSRLYKEIKEGRQGSYSWNDDKYVHKRTQTLIDKYGVDNPFKSPVVKESIKTTCLIKYGFENPSQSEHIKNKKRETTTRNYGTDHHLKLDKYKKIVSESTKKTRELDPIIVCEYCNKEVKGVLNYKKWHGNKCKHNPNNTSEVFTCPHCNKNTVNKGMYNRWHGSNCKLAK